MTAVLTRIAVAGLLAVPRTGWTTQVKEHGTETMTQAHGEFDIKMLPVARDSGVTAMSMEKQYRGDLMGAAKGEFLSSGDPAKGNAGYVAMERVTGTLGGRTGSFSIMQMGQMATGTAPSLSVVIVPGSGTGELSGLHGTMTIVNAAGHHRYTLEYEYASH
jgi:expansin (peptidoglycan-binding protein)